MSRPWSRAIRIAAGIAVALITLGACRTTTPAQPPAPDPGVELPNGFDTTVKRIVDGDTLVVDNGHTIRLIGVDTPETVHPSRPVECFGSEASAFLATVLPVGTGVRLVGDVEATDIYGRTLAYVYRLPDGLLVNAALVREGYAASLTIAPNVALAHEFTALATEAREAGRGLWGACDQE